MTESTREPQAARRFTLVLSGGGARGFSHAGVLRGLELLGYRPSAVVGVSMGAVVAATYALRPDWYEALLDLDMSTFPKPLHRPDGATLSIAERIRWPITLGKAVWEMLFGWGAGTTELALPLARGDQLLADGVHSDIAPMEVARSFGHPVVLAIDPGQALVTGQIENWFSAQMRAIEICQMHHAHLRFSQADLVLRPPFQRTIDTLEFDAKRECIAAGLRIARTRRREIERLLSGDEGKAA